MCASSVDTTLLLVALDERGIEVFKNRLGWWWFVPNERRDGVVEMNGPFRSAVETGMNALEKRKAKAA